MGAVLQEAIKTYLESKDAYLLIVTKEKKE